MDAHEGRLILASDSGSRTGNTFITSASQNLLASQEKAFPRPIYYSRTRASNPFDHAWTEDECFCLQVRVGNRIVSSARKESHISCAVVRASAISASCARHFCIIFIIPSYVACTPGTSSRVRRSHSMRRED